MAVVLIIRKVYAAKYPDAHIAIIKPRNGTKVANEIISDSTPPITSIYLPIPLNGNVSALCTITVLKLSSKYVINIYLKSCEFYVVWASVLYPGNVLCFYMEKDKKFFGIFQQNSFFERLYFREQN